MHDILDYTMLNNQEASFKKTIEPFDIQNSISEIIMIQNDKAKMKNIKVKTSFKGFNDEFGFLVKTD